MTNEFNFRKEKKVRKKGLKEIKQALKAGYITISDDLNYYTSMRHDLKKIAENQDLMHVIIHISTPLEICIQWNGLRGTPIPDELIREIQKKFDNFEKYNWEIPLISLDLSKINNIDAKSLEVASLISKEIERKKKKIEHGRPKSDLNTLYNEKLDKITREIIGDLIKNTSNEDKKRKLLRIRKEFILEYRDQRLKEKMIATTFKIYVENKLDPEFR